MIVRSRFLAISIVVIALSGCDTLVSDDHQINNRWEFQFYRFNDGSLDSLSGTQSPVLLVKKSATVEGNGPLRNFTGECEVFEDGEMIIQNLNVIGGGGSDTVRLSIDSLYFDRLSGVNRYTFDAEFLILTSEVDGLDIVYKR